MFVRWRKCVETVECKVMRDEDVRSVQLLSRLYVSTAVCAVESDERLKRAFEKNIDRARDKQRSSV